jgi:hypothetical protein
MVGWRFKVTDGYVSGDEVSTASTDMDSTFLSEELYDLMDGDANSSMASSMSGAVGSNRVRVPFQELIDTALSYMYVGIYWDTMWLVSIIIVFSP